MEHQKDRQRDGWTDETPEINGQRERQTERWRDKWNTEGQMDR